MAKFIVRHLEGDVKARLKRRAERHSRSMDEEVPHILRDALKKGSRQVPSLGSRIAARFKRAGQKRDCPNCAVMSRSRRSLASDHSR